MAIVRPFTGLRPKKEYSAKLASPPYDVLSSEEAREMAKGNSISFLHVIKPEIDLDPETNPYDKKVYEKGSENLQKFINDGILIQDREPAFYVYKQIMGNHQQIGLVACASVQEYENDIIKRHELTRSDKEDDRVNLINHLNAQTGPVFLTYRANKHIDNIINKVIQNDPEYDFRDEKSVQHIFWVVNHSDLINEIISEFGKVKYLYVADGHHRSAAAMRIKQMKEKENPNHTGGEEYNFFLTVIFPDNQMRILDYNRVVVDLNGLNNEEFIEKVSEVFRVDRLENHKQYKPNKKHCFGMYLNGFWYKLEAKDTAFNPDEPVNKLDVSILQNNLLSPVLGIDDPRKDKRIDFVGGIRGLIELEKRIDSGQWTVAFALYPTSMDDLIAIADAGKIMPPKSTWFEPKLKSGIVTHLLQ
jgi:uncharacterized protein (DUF1015 family)